MSRCVRCFVSGRVQGVFFRAATQQKAQDLGITGWARNTADGGVELVACGAREKVAALQDWLWQGPNAAQVDEVTCTPIADEGFDGFQIRYRY